MFQRTGAFATTRLYQEIECDCGSCFRELELLPQQGCTRRLSVTVGHVSENWSFCHYKVVPGDYVPGDYV